ncbi:MAG TPA: terminase family protein [Terriglobia bacterium]|nr:terminase family protein [Terriglobia bacterium]
MPRPKGEPAVETASVPGPALQLLPYQQRWVEDNSPLKIVVKGRQIGFSFAATLRAVFKCLERKTTWVFLSKGERQSRLLMERVHEHIHSCGIVAQAFESTFFEGTTTRQLEARFANGSVIYGLPANPDTARGYSGHVTLDEFAFHLDADKIYAALYPTITRGYSLEVISTPNGQQGKFFELAKAAGLTEGEPERTGIRDQALGISGTTGAEERSLTPAWSGHWCDIAKAVRQGLRIDLDLLRAGVDEEAWRQEFCCEFLSGGSQWIASELFERCVSQEASAEPVILSAEREGSRPAQLDGAILPERAIYAGWDVARKRDLSVIWLVELVGDVTWTRGVIEMRDLPTPDQVRQARSIMPLVRRMEIDQSGMGLAIFEALEREFPDKVEGVQFTSAKKETLAVRARRRMEESKVRLPDDRRIRQSFQSVKKSSNALGQARFDAEHDSKYGHADHWWAFCLAEAAAQQRPDTYHLVEAGKVMGRPIVAGVYGTAL